jgi:hypothetical protein
VGSLPPTTLTAKHIQYFPAHLLAPRNAEEDLSGVNMPFSHHSHSGQFCEGHARDSLEAVIQKAIRQKMRVFALTEHMPRAEEDLYPEEVCTLPCVPVEDLWPRGKWSK